MTWYWIIIYLTISCDLTDSIWEKWLKFNDIEKDKTSTNFRIPDNIWPGATFRCISVQRILKFFSDIWEQVFDDKQGITLEMNLVLMTSRETFGRRRTEKFVSTLQMT